MDVKKQKARIFIGIADAENVPLHVDDDFSHPAQRRGRVHVTQNIHAAVGAPVPVAVAVGD